MDVGAWKFMLKHLELTNFRNYEKHSIDFGKTTILVGANGIGKTNILEAICLISTGRSWRTNKDNEVVKWGADLAKIKGFLADLTLEMIIQKIPTAEHPQTKLVKINDVKKKLTEILGRLPTVLFSPEEIHLIDGAPVLRRRFLDLPDGFCDLIVNDADALFVVHIDTTDKPPP